MSIQNSDKYNALRNQYQCFYFKDFKYEIDATALKAQFHFKIDDIIEFYPSFEIPKKDFLHFDLIDKEDLNLLIFHIGMIELISYWKAICPKEIVIEPYKLTDSQTTFWKKIYFNGLGEFFYTNGIKTNEQDFVHISSTSSKDIKPISFEDFSEIGTIIPVGGGKDSVVSLELLKDTQSENLALIMNPRGASKSTANIAGYNNRTIEIQRNIDKKLLELNNAGFLNGHTPFSALLGFFTILCATLSGKKYVALSNESSANEPTIPGTHINHQYSKSFEFEKDFRNYIFENISSNVQYFSLLRPLSEIQIAALFARNSKYFFDFKSCNAGSKSDVWCGKCSKCMFAFIILSPFIEARVLEKIFSKNMLDDSELKNYFDELTGIANEKPFECVGTIDEVNEALVRCESKYSKETQPILLKYYYQTNANNIQLSDFMSIEPKHFLNDFYLEKIINALQWIK